MNFKELTNLQDYLKEQTDKLKPFLLKYAQEKAFSEGRLIGPQTVTDVIFQEDHLFVVVHCTVGYNYEFEVEYDKLDVENDNGPDEFDYLRWFRLNADFGPGHGDVIDHLHTYYKKETGRDIPEGWEDE